MLHKLKIRVEAKVILALVGISFLVAFGSRQQNKTICNTIVVVLENSHENHFVSKSDVIKVIEGGGNAITTKRFSQINLRALENNLKKNKYIADAQLYGDIKGNLIVKVWLHRPIARLLRPNQPDSYLAEGGMLLPVSNTFSSRTLLISGAIVKRLIPFDNIHQVQEGRQLMEVIQYINKKPFWKAQIAQLDFTEKGKMIIYPQVTDQRIEFGKLTDIEKKFKKIMIFYKKILPQKGWTKYNWVNVEYDDQIVSK